MEGEDRKSKDAMVAILLVFFIVLVVLLSIDWTARTFNPMVLLFGILVAGIIWMARRYTWGAGPERWPRLRFCPGYGRTIPWRTDECPHCGHAFPPMLPKAP